MNIIKTAHAAIISEDLTKVYWEKNKRFNDDFTFFWWKLEDWEDYKTWLLRELQEETWINFSDKIIHILEEKKSVIIGLNEFIWNLYLIYITSIEAEILLNSNEKRNMEYTFSDIESIPYAFPELKEKLINALNYKK